jgi:hypothetical protein
VREVDELWLAESVGVKVCVKVFEVVRVGVIEGLPVIVMEAVRDGVGVMDVDLLPVTLLVGDIVIDEEADPVGVVDGLVEPDGVIDGLLSM